MPEYLHLCRGISLAFGARIWARIPSRLKSTGGRPFAPLGSRILTNQDDIFKHNMWDHVQWTEEDKQRACQKVMENSSVQIPLQDQGKYDADAYIYWESFYEIHHNKFFKDRKWLLLEFPELLPVTSGSPATDGSQSVPHLCPQPSLAGSQTETRHIESDVPTPQHRDSETTECHHSCYGERVEAPKEESSKQMNAFPGQNASFRILEVGCGVGNSVFPIIGSIKETGSFLYCCDFSPRAVQMVKDHPDYDQSMCHAFVHDVCDEATPFPFPPQSLDVILAVFVLSSIHPERMQAVVNRLSSLLKCGGMFLFRDYGRYDFSQLRFKKGQCLSENFYTRQDGTCVYFFTKDEVHSLFSNAGLEAIQNLEDRRLQVNRGKKVAMHRVWMQSKYKKLQPRPPS